MEEKDGKIKSMEIQIYIDGFCGWMRRREVAERTLDSYRFKAAAYCRFLAGRGKQADDAVREDVALYLDMLLIKKRLASNTRRLHYMALKQFYDYMISQGMVADNYLEEINPPKKERRKKGALTNDQIQMMIYAPGMKTEIGMRDTALLCMLTALVVRVSALCKLKVSDIRMEELEIPPKCQHCGQIDYSGRSRLRGKKEKMMIVTVHEKGGKFRDIPLHEKAAFFLNQYLVHREHGAESDILFPSYKAKRSKSDVVPITRHGVLGVIRRYANEVGISWKVSPHSFRHAAITWLLDCGIDPQTVQNLVGHSSLETTSIYRNVSHRSFVWSGATREKSLLEAIDTPLEDMFGRG